MCDHEEAACLSPGRALSPFIGIPKWQRCPKFYVKSSFEGEFGLYTVDKFAGSGGQGRVQTCILDENGCEYAVKTYLPPRSKDEKRASESQMLSFHIELSTLKYLRDCGLRIIPRLIDFGFLGDVHSALHPFIVMENLGRSVEQLKPKGYIRCTDRTALVLTLEILKCLKLIHECGIVHNDVKLENVCFTRDGKSLRLIDFGSASQYGRFADGKIGHKMGEMDAKGRVKRPLGTIGYASRAAHLKQPPLPYDDIESLIYSITVLFREGLLLWNVDKASDKSAVLELKKVFWDRDGLFGARLPLQKIFAYFKGVERTADGCFPYESFMRVIEDEIKQQPNPFEHIPTVRLRDENNNAYDYAIHI